MLIALLGAAGVAFAIEGAVSVDTPRLQAALEDLANGRPEPATIEPARASLERDGDVLVVRASDRVPLARLYPLAALALPRVTDGELAFRLEPRVARRERIERAVRAALAA